LLSVLREETTGANAAEPGALSHKHSLGQIGYSSDSLEELHASICRWLRGPRQTTRTIGYVNPHVFNMAMKNERLRQFLAEADIVSVDGLGVALGVLVLKGQRVTRTVMTPLFDRVLETSDLPPLTAVLIGATDEVAVASAAAMNAASPKIKIIDTINGFAPMPDYLAFLRRHADADVVLIAMGSPRSEELSLQARDQFAGKLLWCIGGGTLHFYAGTLWKVPRVVSALGLQWLWRMLNEPRITPRYFVGIPVFLGHLLRIMFSSR